MVGNRFQEGISPPNKKILNEGEIIRLYTKENKSVSKISKLFDCSNPVIYRILKEHKIPLRGFKNHTRETRIKISAIQQGIPIEHWKDYITPLNHQIRTSLEYRNWIKNVFQKDNFTCMGCGQHGSNLEAHHIKGFIEIIKENNIKTFEDALACKILWNIQNGITLCPKCHAQIDRYRHPKTLNLNIQNK